MADLGGGAAMRLAMVQAALTLPELWLRYVGLGGTSTVAQLEAYIDGRPPGPFDDAQHDVLAQALNERFMELHLDGSIPYRRA